MTVTPMLRSDLAQYVRNQRLGRAPVTALRRWPEY